MKNFKRISLSLVLATVTLLAAAIVTDVIKLRDGSVYYGYIWMQLNNGEIGISADSSVVYLPQSEISSIEYKNHDRHGRQLADICLYKSDTAVAVIEVIADSVLCDTIAAFGDDGVFVEEDASDTVEYVDGDSVLRGVEILEEGAIVKYCDRSPREVKLRMSDVREITRPPRNPKQLNGLNDEIVTTTGRSFKGQIISIEPGRTVRINDSGRIYRIPVDQIAVQRRVAIASDQSVMAQSPLIDNVYLNGEGVVFDVLLVEQDFAGGTFRVIDSDNVVKQYSLSQLSKIRRHPNADYEPRMEFKYEDGAYYICGQKAIPEEGQLRRGRIRAEVSLANVADFRSRDSKIIFECADNMANRRIILVPIPQIEYGEAVFSSKYLLEKAIPAETQSVDRAKRILRREYAVLPGYYALVDSENASLILLHVI